MQPNSNSFFLCLKTKCLNIYIYNLCDCQATGLDYVTPRFVKDCSVIIIASPLAHNFNYSSRQCLMPDCLRATRVAPLLQNNDKTAVCNYIPVPILSVLLIVELYFKENVFFIYHLSIDTALSLSVHP